MKTRLSTVMASGLSAAILAAGACSELARTPSKALEAAFTAADEGLYSETEQYLAVEVLSVLRGELGALGGGISGMWDEYTRDGALERVEILGEEIRGEGARVSFRLHFEDGTSADDEWPLIRERGHWKITSEGL